MTATDTLRAMLDERGVEWDYGITGATTTRFSVNGIDLTFTPMRDGLVCSTIRTPEQVIATTLGDDDATATRQRDVGKCNADETDRIECGGIIDGRHYDIHIMECSACGHTYEHVNGDYEYCPRCGRKRRDFVE